MEGASDCMNPIVPTGGEKAAIVQQASQIQACRDLVKCLASDEAKLATQDKATLVTKWHIGGALIALKRETPHGDWGKLLEQIGLDQRRADECRQIAMVSRMRIDELGSQRAVLRYLREHAEEEAKARGEQSSGAATLADAEDDDTPESGEGVAPSAPAGGTGQHGSPKPTAPSPAATKPPQKPAAGEQQSLPGMGKPEDAEAAKKRLDEKTRRQARDLARKAAEFNREFEQLMRCKDAPVTEEIRRLYRLSGLNIEDRQPPETAGGFESKQEPAGVRWRELEAAERLLEQAAGRQG